MPKDSMRSSALAVASSRHAITRSGRNPSRCSRSTLPLLATRGRRFAASGKSLYSDTATTFAPAPAAYSSSVACGARLTMRCAGIGSVTRRPLLSVTLTSAQTAVHATLQASSAAIAFLMERFYRATRTLMVQGTSSGAGKSTLVAGLCRVLARRGVRVAPFKPQNMSLNSAVAADGGEIARAQALQAIAARTAPRTDMNPVLIKPSSDTRAQVVVAGKPYAELEAGAYMPLKGALLPVVLGAFERLRAEFDAVIVEG